MKNRKILEETQEDSKDDVTEVNPMAKIKKRIPWVKWGALAACLALAIFTVIKIIPENPVEPVPAPIPVPSDLPLLAITEGSGIVRMGVERSLAYDISEMVNHNPWTEFAEISTLPVYSNVYAYDERYQVQYIDGDQRRDLLRNVAGSLGIDVNHLELYSTPIYATLEDSGMKIEVDQQMTAEITFDPAITLPEKYHFTHYATYEEVVAVAEYLKEKYIDLIGMDHPQVNIDGGSYSILSEEDIEIYGAGKAQDYSIEFYDGSGDLTNQVVNYNFNRVAFYCDEDGKLDLIRIFQPDLSGKVGEYPIITADTAKELLKKGNYITTSSKNMPGLEYVAKVELVYRAGGRERYFLPYYRFYVELPDMERANGLKTYGAYYVPAVEGKYISDMPLWDNGRFN